MKASEKLTRALIQAHAPQHMIDDAQAGHYGDFTSDLAMPITQLVNEATFHGLNDIAKRAMQGEFDGQ